MRTAAPPEDVKQDLTLQEPRGAVQALRAELVVAKRAQELADEDIHLLRDSERTHVAKEQLHLLVTPLRSMAFLQAAGGGLIISPSTQNRPDG